MAITLVQNKGAEDVVGSANGTVTLTSGPTQGNLVVVAFTGPVVSASVTDPSGYTRRANKDNVGASRCALIVAKVAGASESATITFTHTSGVWGIEAYEFAGTGASGAEFDAAAAGSAVNSVTSAQPGSLTPAVSGEVLVTATFVGGGNGGSEAIDSSFNITDAATFARFITGYKIKTDALAENPTISWASAQNQATVMAAFKPPGVSMPDRMSPRGTLRGNLRGTT